VRTDVAGAGVPPLDSNDASRSVIIATLPRSGSWLLAEGMEDTGLCGTPREYFREDYEDIYRREWGIPPHASYRDYAEAVIGAGTTANGTFAVKCHWRQFARLLSCCRASAVVNDMASADLIESIFPNARYVYLTRRNKARQAISLYRAMSLDVWWAFDEDDPTVGGDAAGIGQPDFDELAHLEKGLVRDDICWMNFFEANRLQPYLLTFEDLTTSYDCAVRQAISFVHDLERIELPVPAPQLRRQANATTEAWLEKYMGMSTDAASLLAARREYADRSRAFAEKVRRR
jgi:trehalose 2-sulfotransferase